MLCPCRGPAKVEENVEVVRPFGQNAVERCLGLTIEINSGTGDAKSEQDAEVGPRLPLNLSDDPQRILVAACMMRRFGAQETDCRTLIYYA